MKIERDFSFRALVILVILSLIATGCSAKKKIRPELPKDLPQSWTSETTPADLPLSRSLFDLINHETVKQLVDEALENNPDLSATAMRLKASEHLLYGTKSRMMPKLNAGFSAERNNQSLNSTGGRKTGNSLKMSLGLSWELDLWGRLADEHAAAELSVLSQQKEYALARDALAARVIQAWIVQVSARRSVAIETERVELIRRIERILIERFRHGNGTLDELSAAKSRTEIAKADLAAVESELNRAIRNIEILLGRYPRGELLTGVELPDIDSPPVSLPAAALINRPDVSAAMFRVESARRIAAAARKARLPSLQLSGQVFKESARIGSLGGSTAYWGILGSVFQPIFEGGRLKKEAEARKLEAGAELLTFQQVILTAMNEVEGTLENSKNLELQTKAIQSALRESESSSHYYEERYREGLTNLQTLLDAREQEILVKNRLNQLMAGRLKNRIDLAMALGIGVGQAPDGKNGEIKK